MRAYAYWYVSKEILTKTRLFSKEISLKRYEDMGWLRLLACAKRDTGWPRLIGCLKLQVIFLQKSH